CLKMGRDRFLARVAGGSISGGGAAFSPRRRSASIDNPSGGDLMRQRRPAMHGTQAERAHRRGLGRLAVLASLLSMFVLVSGAQAARAQAPVVEEVTPNAACPGETVTFTGKNFASPEEAMWKDTAVTPKNAKTVATVKSSTEATAI